MTTQMSRRGFVDAMVEVAVDQVVAGEVAALDSPPGRSPALELIARSEWFRTLDAEGRSSAIDVMRSVATGVLHRVFVVLDGATAIEDVPSGGQLQLLWRTDDDIVDLTDVSSEPDLHDLLKEALGH